jgi:Lanthionine synthetase C-like protein/Protein kinase domain
MRLSGYRSKSISPIQQLDRQYRQTLFSYLSGIGSDWDVSWRETREIKWCQLACKEKEIPSQGWKIHVSASAAECVELCHNALPWLLSRRVAFKILADLRSILRVNSGSLGATQTGKIITVYPCDEKEVRNLANELDRRWPVTDGPAVSSDVSLRPGGAVFLRYGAFSGEVLVNRQGMLLPAMRAPNGDLVEDRRSTEGHQVEWARPPIRGLAPAVPEAQGPFEIGGESYLPLFLLHASPRGKVFAGLKLTDAAYALLKLRWRGIGGGLAGTVVREPLSVEHDVLRALNNSGRVAPRPMGYFKGHDFAMLVMEYLEGETFSELEPRQQISHLPALANAVSQLHAAGFAHRDVKLANVIVSKSKVRLVDFELAVPFSSQEAISAGTRGYLPPETEALVDGAGDVYALGACVAHVLLGYDPSGLPDGGGRLIGLLSLFGWRCCTKVIKSMLDPRPERRPTAVSLVPILQNFSRKVAFETQGKFNRRIRPSVSSKWCLRVAYEAALATRDFRESTPQGTAWRSHHFEHLGPAEGINVGSAGVILGLLSIDRACGCVGLSIDIQEGAKWLKSRNSNRLASGLFTGDAGVAVALATAGRRFRRNDWITAARARLTAAVEAVEHCDLFSGTAGVLWAACILTDILEEDGPYRLAARCGDTLLRLAEVREALLVWPADEAGEPPLTGAAHGSAGIALALALWGRLANRPEAVEVAFETFERLFRNGRVREGAALRRALNGNSSHAPVLQWCHGIAGYLWCMLQAFGDNKRLQPAIDWSLERCVATNAVGPPLYCHGMAGELELWRMIGGYPRLAELAAKRAERLASALRLQLQRRHGLCVWGAEDPEILTPDLWVGFLGPATALTLYARRISDPLLSSAWLRFCASPIL